MSLSQVPREILEIILSNVVPKDWNSPKKLSPQLLELRLVCKKFDFILSTELFRKISYSSLMRHRKEMSIHTLAWLFCAKYALGVKHRVLPLAIASSTEEAIHAWKRSKGEECLNCTCLRDACTAFLLNKDKEWSCRELSRESRSWANSAKGRKLGSRRKKWTDVDYLLRGKCLPVAAYSGDMELIEDVIREGGDPGREEDPYGYPLYIAAYTGRDHVVRRLIDAGADVDESVGLEGTPIEVAASMGHEKVVACLLEGNADVGFALADAVENRYDDIVRLLLPHAQDDINATREHNNTTLGMAVADKNKKLIKMLIASPHLDPNGNERSRFTTPLVQLLQWGWLDMAELLLAHPKMNANEASGTYRETPLQVACSRGYSDMVQMLLLRSEVDPNKNPSWSYTPFERALNHNFLPIVNMLLDRPDLKVTLDLITFSIWRGEVDVVRRLVSRHRLSAAGAEELLTAAVSSNSLPMVHYMMSLDKVKSIATLETVFRYAVEGDAQSVTDWLMTQDNVDLNHDGGKGSLLMRAVSRNNHRLVVQLLARPEVNVNAVGVFGTALHCASAASVQTRFIKLLLQRSDLDPNIQAPRGRDEVDPIYSPTDNTVYSFSHNWALTPCGGPPLTVAMQSNSTGVEFFLDDERTDPNVLDAYGRSPLWWAIFQRGCYSEGHVNQLASRPETDLNTVDCQGWPPLLLAIHLRQPQIAVALIDQGPRINPNCVNRDGWTPLLSAVRCNCPSVVAKLLRHPDTDQSIRLPSGKSALDLAKDLNRAKIVALLTR